MLTLPTAIMEKGEGERKKRRERFLGLVYQTPNSTSPATATRPMAATLNALEFVEACKEFMDKYSKREAHGSTPELSILRESNAGWTLIEHSVSIDKIVVYG